LSKLDVADSNFVAFDLDESLAVVGHISML
jgi:hypothetical protein